MSARAWLPRAALTAVLAVAAVGALLAQDRVDFEVLQVEFNDLGAWAPAGFVASFAIATVLFLPGTLFGLAGGALFGPAWGTVWNLAGATLGATFAFLVARYIASDWVAFRVAGRLKQLVGGVEAEGWRFVALTRLVPLVPFNLLNYALGLTRLRLAHYSIATAVCMVPGAAAYAWLGYAGREMAAGNRQALSFGLLGLALLALVIFAPRLIRRLRNHPWALISTAELRRRLDAGFALTVVDVRSRQEFTGPLGHIPGARNVPLTELAGCKDELAEAGGRAIVLVCRTDKRSASAAGILAGAGLRDVLILRGGMEEWQRDATAMHGPGGFR